MRLDVRQGEAGPRGSSGIRGHFGPWGNIGAAGVKGWKGLQGHTVRYSVGMITLITLFFLNLTCYLSVSYNLFCLKVLQCY